MARLVPRQPWHLPLIVAATLAACDEGAAPDDAVRSGHAPEIAAILPAEEALANAPVAHLDPATLNDAEIRKAIGTGPLCAFHYTRAGNPVVAMQAGAAPAGVVKLNGHLILLEASGEAGGDAAARSLVLAAGPVRLRVIAPPQGADIQAATMLFEVGQDLTVGYRGYLGCPPESPVASPRP
ncbi:DUF6692 family protein [Falsiroseomonas sp.]|uniref:DUF6692 family protein n=1 Tax=Falsiroseomonas sp. TaxID=2870721 RepID=UPI00356A9313